MKTTLVQIISDALITLQKKGALAPDLSFPEIQLSPPKDKNFGDYASNIALILAKIAGIPPRDMAAQIIASLPHSHHVSKVEIAGPGFINFYLDEKSHTGIVTEILAQGSRFGHNTHYKDKKIHMEYVSANPTGPLHVGHGRGAAYGDCLARLLAANGYQVHREYYVNDAGRQMDILALSVWMRYLQLNDEAITLPPNAYQGDYIVDIAQNMINQYEARFHHTQESLDERLAVLMTPEVQSDPEKSLDATIQAARDILGETNYRTVHSFGLEAILNDIREDLEEMGVTYDQWFYESSLHRDGFLEQGVALLKKHGYTYEKEGALWFASTQLGDEKDRVLIRHDGKPTYFAADVAYHLHKYRSGYDLIINVWGADHHGYIPRIKAFLQGLGEDPSRLKVLLVQFATLFRGKEKVQMSTRSGQFITLRELRSEVGNDATRFFYVMRKSEQHLEFDLELAKSQSQENPVYYIQYAHARLASVWRELEKRQESWDVQAGKNHLNLLISPHEKKLLSHLMQFPILIKDACDQSAPHLIAHYLSTLAQHFHAYYNAERFLVDNSDLRHARLCLAKATEIVLKNGLQLLGLSAPEVM